MHWETGTQASKRVNSLGIWPNVTVPAAASTADAADYVGYLGLPHHLQHQS